MDHSSKEPVAATRARVVTGLAAYLDWSIFRTCPLLELTLDKPLLTSGEIDKSYKSTTLLFYIVTFCMNKSAIRFILMISYWI